MTDTYAFQKLAIYQQGMEYLDVLYDAAEEMSGKSASSLAQRLRDAASHLVVQVATRSSGGSEIERSFMIDGTLMSLYETIACLDIAQRRRLLGARRMEAAHRAGRALYDSLQKMKKAAKK